MDRNAGDGADSAEDSGSSQPYPSTLPGIPEAIFIIYLSLCVLHDSIVFEFAFVKTPNCYVSCRAVHDNYFNGCRDQWKRIRSKIISRKLL